MMKIMFLFILLVCSGCMVPITPLFVKRNVLVDPKAYEPCMKTGTATIKGQAFLKTRGGETKFGAGETIYLIPVTPDSTEEFMALSIGQRLEWSKIKVPEPRKTIADGHGNFEFIDLPVCDFYLETAITWEVPYVSYNGYSRGTSLSGGFIGKKVRTNPSKTTNIMLTR